MPADRDERDGARLLGALRDLPEESTGGVSVERAMKAGRRRIYARRAASALAAVAAVVLVAVVPAVFLRGQEIEPAQAEFGLWTREFTVGSAGGFTPSTYETGKLFQRIELRPASEAMRGTEASVTMYARGAWTPRGALAQAPSLGGRKAYWITDSDGLVEYAWEWTEGGWGVASLAGTEANRDRAHHVAESVVTGPGTPVTVPFTVRRSAVADGLRITGVRVTYAEADGAQVAALRLSLSDRRAPSSADWVELGVAAGGPAVVPNTAIDGRPAEVSGTRVAFAGKGFQPVVQAQGTRALAAAGGVAGLKQLAAAVRVVSDPAERATWTSDPLR